MYYYNNELPPQQGWICPKCGRVNAPWLPTCGCVSNQTSGSSYLVKTSSISRDSHEIAKDEPQTDRSMAVGKRSDATADKYHLYGKTTTDEPQTCDTCKHKGKYAYCRLCGRLSENNYEPQTEKLPLHEAFEMAVDECKRKHKGCENCDMDCVWRDEQSGKEQGMRKIKFYVEAYSEMVEVEDDATEEEIQDDFENWMDGAVQCGWYEE